MSPKLRIFLLMNLIFIPLDQVSKWAIRQNLRKGLDAVEVIPGLFQLVHVENTGAAFGFLSGYSWSMWLFIPFTVVAGGILVSMLKDVKDDARFMPLTLGLILAGAIGNFIDRVHKQGVTDFLRFYTDNPSIEGFLIDKFGTAEWPSFNVADICVVVGVLLFVVHELFFREKEPEPGSEDASSPETAEA